MAKSKAEKQAALAVKIEEARKEQELAGPTLYDNPSIDDLLGPDPSPGTKPVTTTKTSTPKEKKVSTTPTAVKLNKGQMVAFRTKTGQVVIGSGVLYYVARMNNKLHYKEASQVTILPDDYKEGDPLPGNDMPTEEEFDDLV